MEDRFKVRLWDITEQKFIEVTEIDYYTDGEEVTVYYDGDTFETILDEGYLKAGFLEQCTGLKDKNGKLIYEGDILHDLFKKSKFSVVQFDEETLGFNCGCHALFTYKYEKELEIIGNIHENPELLEGNK